MRLAHIVRTLMSSGALVGGAVCILQVPGQWDRQDATLSLKAESLREQLHDFTVVVDAGHGGEDGGTSGGSLLEKDGTLDIAKRVEAALRKQGVRVRMTREDDRYLALSERCEIANSTRADAFVSIHLNASPGTDAEGFESYYSSKQNLVPDGALRARLGLDAGVEVKDVRSALLAGFIQKRVAGIGNTNDRGARDSGLYVVKNTRCPAVLLECGYVTSAEEADRLKRGAHRERIAAVIADGVCRFLVATRFNPMRGIQIGGDLLAAPAGAAPVTSG